MNICRVTRAFLPFRDGISHHTYFLSKHQASLGHKVWVLQPHSPSCNRDGFKVKSISLGFLASKYGYKSVTALFAIKAGFETIHLHKEHKLDIIHGHGDIIEAIILKQFAKFLGIPLIMTIHSGLNQKKLYRMIASWIWQKVDGIITVSQEISRDLENLEAKAKCLSVISSGVDLSKFTQATEESRQKARSILKIDSSAFVIASVGRLTYMKGFEYLIKAVQKLADVDSIQLYIIGDGPLKGNLEALVSDNRHIHLLGSKPHDRIQTYLHAADAFILPSIDRPGEAEGTPTAVMEAMATGLPVITTDSGGTKHVIEAIQGLTLVPQRDSRVLTDAIMRVVKDIKLRQCIGELNRDRVQSRDWSKIASEVCRFYERVIASA